MADAIRSIGQDYPRRARATRALPSAPPHDLDIEESLLGAMLLSADAVAKAIEVTAACDFYKSEHGYIFSACESLAARGEPVDAVTVSDELGRTKLGDEIHEPVLPLLMGLQANTPSTANTGHYARRVAELAAERRLLGHAVELADAVREADPERRDRAVEAIAGETDDAVRIGGGLVRESLATLMCDPQPPVEAELLRRTDGRCLLVRGVVTVLHAEPATGKSWLACEAVRQVSVAGENAVVLDYEGNGRTWAERLVQLGTPVDAARRIDYIRPGGVPMHAITRAALASSPALVVIDGLAAALAQAGLDEDRASECLSWLRGVARALALAGAAVLVIDHVVKDKEHRGRWGRGSGAKLGEVDVAYGLEVAEPYARGQAGSAHLRVMKDRHGAIGAERSLAATARFTPTGDDGLRIELEAPASGEGEWAGPTRCADAIAELLGQLSGQELTANKLCSALKAIGKSYRRDTVLSAAMQAALDPSSPVVMRTGPNNSHLYRYDESIAPLPFDDEEPF